MQLKGRVAAHCARFHHSTHLALNSLPAAGRPCCCPSCLPACLQSIRNSSRYTTDLSIADFVFVDMHCYHAAGKSVLLPYAAVSDVDMDVSVAVFSGGDSGGGGVCIGGGDAGGGVSPGVSLGAALEVQLQPPRHRRWRCCLPAACLLPANPV